MKVSASLFGSQRPLMRGWLHGAEAAALLACLALFALNNGGESVARRALFVFLVGKAASYAASANLHLVGFHEEPDFHKANAVDWAFIPWNMYSSAAPLLVLGCGTEAQRAQYVLFSCVVSCIVLGLVWKTGAYAMDGDRRMNVCRQLQKVGLVAAYLASATVELLCLGTFAPLACKGGVFAAGAISWQISCIPAASRPRIPWHSSMWGGHEDFHLLVFCADCITYATLVARGMMPLSSLLVG